MKTRDYAQLAIVAVAVMLGPAALFGLARYGWHGVLPYLAGSAACTAWFWREVRRKPELKRRHAEVVATWGAPATFITVALLTVVCWPALVVAFLVWGHPDDRA
jgi:hypothetical protein